MKWNFPEIANPDREFSHFMWKSLFTLARAWEISWLNMAAAPCWRWRWLRLEEQARCLPRFRTRFRLLPHPGKHCYSFLHTLNPPLSLLRHSSNLPLQHAFFSMNEHKLPKSGKRLNPEHIRGENCLPSANWILLALPCVPIPWLILSITVRHEMWRA